MRAYWTHKTSADRKSVLVCHSGNVKRLRETLATEAEARDNAQSEWQRMQRGATAFSFSLTLGRADLYPEQKIPVQGFKLEIDDATWLISKTTHTISGSSEFTTALELETALSQEA